MNFGERAAEGLLISHHIFYISFQPPLAIFIVKEKENQGLNSCTLTHAGRGQQSICPSYSTGNILVLTNTGSLLKYISDYQQPFPPQQSEKKNVKCVHHIIHKLGFKLGYLKLFLSL